MTHIRKANSPTVLNFGDLIDIYFLSKILRVEFCKNFLAYDNAFILGVSIDENILYIDLKEMKVFRPITCQRTRTPNNASIHRLFVLHQHYFAERLVKFYTDSREF